MPITLVATPGAPNANTYATEAEAEAYHATRLHNDAWSAATVDTRRRALVMATRYLDALVKWEGWPRFASDQALQWPRSGLMRRGEYDYLEDNLIPQELKDATAEFAFQLLVTDRTLDSDVETQGIRSLTVGPVSITYADGVRAKVLPDAVRHLLVPEWIVEVGGVGSDFTTVELFQA